MVEACVPYWENLLIRELDEIQTFMAGIPGITDNDGKASAIEQAESKLKSAVKTKTALKWENNLVTVSKPRIMNEKRIVILGEDLSRLTEDLQALKQEFEREQLVAKMTSEDELQATTHESWEDTKQLVTKPKEVGLSATAPAPKSHAAAGGSNDHETDNPTPQQQRPRSPRKNSGPPQPPRVNIFHLQHDSITKAQLEQCSILYSENYGKWESKGFKAGYRVKMGVTRLEQNCLFNRNCSVVLAKTESGELLGHAFVCRFLWGDGFASWITQLVVSADHRERGIASKLCAAAFDPHDKASGLVSSHPFAVRALERAKATKCDSEVISQHAQSLIAASGIPNVQNCKLNVGQGRSTIHTDFFVDRSEVNQHLEREEDWRLGPLHDGEEFFAFVFL